MPAFRGKIPFFTDLTREYYGHAVKPSKNLKTWEKTKVQNLVRHRSGRYYARMFGNGKQRWKSLVTAVLEVAKCRLRDVLKADTERAYIPREPSAGRMTMAGAIAILETEIAASRPVRPPQKKSPSKIRRHFTVGRRSFHCAPHGKKLWAKILIPPR